MNKYRNYVCYEINFECMRLSKVWNAYCISFVGNIVIIKVLFTQYD